MATIQRMRVPWSGTGVVGAGLTTFYFGSGTTPPASVLAFFTAIKTTVPTGVTWTVPNTGDIVDDASGALTGVWTGAGGGSVSSTGSNTYAGGVGARVVWNTAGIYRRRRVRGSTFVVPLTTGGYDSDGTIAAGTLTTLLTASGALVAAESTNMMVYSRPMPASVGAIFQVTSSTVPDRVSWLRSRRT